MEYISGIIGVITLIVFFVMAANLGAIKKALIPGKGQFPNKPGFPPREIFRPRTIVYLANREEWKGNKEKAIDHWFNLLYDLRDPKINSAALKLPGFKNNKESIEFVEKKIEDLGGKIPEILTN